VNFFSAFLGVITKNLLALCDVAAWFGLVGAFEALSPFGEHTKNCGSDERTHSKLSGEKFLFMALAESSVQLFT
jgi:hypothetical protein